MSFWGRFSLYFTVAVSLLTLNGCMPSDSSPLDDEKEPHFVLGKSRVNAMDYSGAVEAFNEALEVNPRSAAAHFQLACLFDTPKVSDPAAAIYHYQEFLRLNPKADNADVVKGHIYSCKQQLASDVNSLPITPIAQRQLESLVETNRQLQSELEKWRAYYASQQEALRTNPPAQMNLATPGSQTPDDVTAQSANNVGSTSPTSTRSQTTTPRVVKPRTHTVAARETMASIARKYNVSLTALQTANPGVTPKKLKVGQTLNLPGQ